VLPEISLTDTAHLPDAPANPLPAQDSGYSIKVTTRLVDVGVIAYDKKGRPVMDLNGGDFEVYDNGRKQDIRSFTPAPAAAPAPAPPSPPANAEPSFSNRAPDAVTPSGVAIAPEPGATGATAAPGATILLIDESHIAWPDFSYARGQMLQFLGKVSPAERIGLYSMTATGFRVVVEPRTDHAALAARLKAFTPSALSLAQAQEEESRNRQQINEVHNLSDLNSVNGNRNDVPDASEPVDPQLMSMGDNPARSSLVILAQVARHLASIPGHKSLVWVSSDNVLADWQDQQVGIDKSPKESHSFAVRVQKP
jgi:VWFA-related protein